MGAMDETGGAGATGGAGDTGAAGDTGDKTGETPLDGRGAKRQKLGGGGAKPQRRPPPPGTRRRVFAPYRSVGLVSPTAVPFATAPRGNTTFQITTSVGRSLQTYDLRRGLQLLFVTAPQTPQPITAVATAAAAWSGRLVAAWGGAAPAAARGVWVFQRGKKVADLALPREHAENVTAFCLFGCWIVGVCRSALLVWKTPDRDLYATLRGVSPVAFTTCIATLPTFLNKVIVGRHDGSAEIWNVSSAKLVYTILPPSTAYGAVTAIAPTPALSLVAIAFQHGPILVHDVRADHTVIQLRAPAGVPVTSISFRTDGLGAGDDGKSDGVMATASSASGDITVWDLNDGGRKAGVLRAAHAHPTASAPGGTTRVEFLPGQAVLVSSGLDNSLRTWIFDATPFSPIPRILHERRGHGAPVMKLMFLPTASDGSDDTGKWLLSSSRDRSLWGWSLRRDGQSTELSQGAVQKKAKKLGLLSGDRDSFADLKCPPITSIACTLNRDGGIGALPGKHPIWQNTGKSKQVSAEIAAMTGWESVLTAHENDSKARTWFWGRKRAGRWAFDTGDGGNVTSVAISPCGTFGLVGSDAGGIDMFNMQSGIQRQRFPARLTPMQAKQLRLDVERLGWAEEGDGKKNKFYRGQGKHSAAVVGLAVDNLNKTLVSAGADGKIKFWDFQTALLRHQIDWSSSTRVLSMRFHRVSDLAAFACTDGCVRVVDIGTQKLIRELWPSRNPLPELQNLRISDFAFSHDGHWISACMGPLVLLWDLPTGHLVDAFKLHAECTTLAFSPTGEYLATATRDTVGVDIWTNRALFTHLPTRAISPKHLRAVIHSSSTQAPTASGEGGLNLVADDAEDLDEAEGEEDAGLALLHDPNAGIDSISADLLSLSLVPRSRWQTLVHLDLIRHRNKPIEAPKKPEKAPFFLPSLPRTKPLASSHPGIDPAAEIAHERTRVLKLAREGMRSEFTQLLHRTAAEAHPTRWIEHLKTLSPAAADLEIRSLSCDDREPELFVRALTALLASARDFDLAHACMAVFLRLHGDLVPADPGLRRALAAYRAARQSHRQRVARSAGFVSGMVAFLRAPRV